MAKKLESINERASKALSKFFDKFKYIKILNPESYKNFRSKLKFYCTKHNHQYEKSFETCLYSVGGGCKYCIKEHRLKYKDNSRIDYVIDKFKDKFDVIDNRYLQCKKHSDFKIKITPDLLYKEQLCPYCLKEKQKLSFDKIQQRLDEKFNSKVKLITRDFKTTDDKVEVMCIEHMFKYHVNLGDLLYQNKNCCPIGYYEFKRNKKLKDTDYFISKAKKKFGDKFDYSKVNYKSYDNDPVLIKCNEHNIEFEIIPAYHMNSISGGCPKCKTINVSSAEKEIMNLLDKYNVKYQQGNRQILKGQELDIYIPDYKLAIEYNGLIYHSYGKTYPNNFNELDRYYHLRKTELCEKQGIQLLHIFEHEWINSIKKQIWISIIKYKLNLIQKKYYARKLILKEIRDTKIIKDFLKNNHLQGYVSSSINIGLFKEDELISLITFSKSRFNKKYKYELLRFANKKETICVGCFSKLLKYFIEKYSSSIITYADRRYSQGNLYLKNGFKMINKSEPNYFYLDTNLNIYSRVQFQKHKLQNKLDVFNPNLSEIENVINNNYRIIFDCGNYVFAYENQ